MSEDDSRLLKTEEFYKRLSGPAFERIAEDVILALWWPDCPVDGCANKVCLALDSDKCFVHTPGSAWWKRRRIEGRRLKAWWYGHVVGAWRVLRGKAEAQDV